MSTIKHWAKKVATFVLVAVACLVMATPAMAADNLKITLTNPQAGHTYTLYQIFTGDVEQLGTNTVLTNLKWGTGSTGTGNVDLDVAHNLEGLTGEKLSGAVGKYVKDGTGDAKKAADGKVGTTVEALEWRGLKSGYYVIQDTGSGATGDKESRFVVQVLTGDVTVTQKAASVPDIEKEVEEQSYDINSAGPINYTLSATLKNIDAYKTYKMVFHDTMSKGLTYIEGSATVWLKRGGAADVQLPVPEGKIVAVKNSDGTTKLTVTLDDVKADLYKEFGIREGDTVYVKYAAKLNENAVIGGDGNENKFKLEYSNDPDGGTDFTTEEKEVVYTGKIEIVKFDGDNENIKLAGAKFVLMKDGKFYRYAEETNENGETVKVANWVDNQADATIVTTDDEGQAKFEGLAAGTYTLKEIEAPQGYNLVENIDPITLSVPQHDGEQTVGSLEATAQVENFKGTVLPSTGGMGTTLLYTVGGVLVVGAAATLILKRRASQA